MLHFAGIPLLFHKLCVERQATIIPPTSKVAPEVR
jgi:hypothetical protein